MSSTLVRGWRLAAVALHCSCATHDPKSGITVITGYEREFIFVVAVGAGCKDKPKMCVTHLLSVF